MFSSSNGTKCDCFLVKEQATVNHLWHPPYSINFSFLFNVFSHSNFIGRFTKTSRSFKKHYGYSNLDWGFIGY